MTERFIFSPLSTAADLARTQRKTERDNLRAAAKTRISVTVLANTSTQFLVQSISASLLANGVNADIYEAPFDQWSFELNNPESETFRRRSDYTVLFLSSVRLVATPEDPADKLAANLKRLLTRLKETCRSDVIFVLPESLREGFEQTSVFYRAVSEFRASFRRELDGLVHFVDIDPLIMEFGFEKWHPSKFLMNAKFCCHPNCFPLFGNYIANFIQSLIRRPTRLVITDLDNTLWHGIVGETGWRGVGLDRDGTGYPHLMLQKYLLQLKNAGVLLAICSKNSMQSVQDVFDNRPEMVLKLEDFVANEVNWEPKSANIARILDTLQLTSVGVTFLDDSKFEREEVKSALPEIYVPELPRDPADWCNYLSRSGCLTVAAVSAEDLNKSASYIAEKRRREDAAQHTDYAAFLAGLGLRLTAERIQPANFDRAFELIHKTNQFNLTMRRLSRRELENLTTDESAFCHCYRLQDKYSDYGIISVFIAEQKLRTWEITTWLMSCRTIGRGVEDRVFEHFVSTRLKDGDSVSGIYVDSEKNRLVADLLGRLGFAANPETGGHVFTVGKCVNPAAPHIAMEPQA